jgi:hypothetical protein
VCPFYRVLEHGNFRRISQRMQVFCVTKLQAPWAWQKITAYGIITFDVTKPELRYLRALLHLYYTCDNLHEYPLAWPPRHKKRWFPSRCPAARRTANVFRANLLKHVTIVWWKTHLWRTTGWGWVVNTILNYEDQIERKCWFRHWFYWLGDSSSLYLFWKLKVFIFKTPKLISACYPVSYWMHSGVEGAFSQS